MLTVLLVLAVPLNARSDRGQGSPHGGHAICCPAPGANQKRRIRRRLDFNAQRGRRIRLRQRR